MTRREAYARTMEFLKACTLQVGSLETFFRINDPPQLGPIPELEGRLRQRFGEEGLNRRRGLPVPPQRFADALDFLDEIDPQPTNPWGMVPIWLWVVARFQILDPSTGAPLPGQDASRFNGAEYEYRVPLGTSGLRLILKDRAKLGIEFCIPTADGDVIARVVPWLEQHLPCKLSASQWRVWTPTRTGSFKARRLALGATALATRDIQ
jgi:hypothetical protein